MSTSSVRQRRAQQTRERIREAAKQLFLDQGYAATTITEIARVAGVAPQTVYFAFGSKAAVLSAVMDAAIVGDDQDVPLLQRPEVTAVNRVEDPVRRLGRVVQVAADITSRLAPLYELVRSGAVDDEVREVLDRHEDQRYRTLRALAGTVEAGLRPDVSVEQATDRLYALLSHDVFWLLVHRRGWSGHQWRRYVETELVGQLMASRARGSG